MQNPSSHNTYRSNLLAQFGDMSFYIGETGSSYKPRTGGNRGGGFTGCIAFIKK